MTKRYLSLVVHEAQCSAGNRAPSYSPRAFLKRVPAIIVAGFIVLTSPCEAQVKRILDSIEAGMGGLKHDTERVSALSAMCFYNYSVDPDRGLGYGQQALTLALSIHWKQGIAHAYGNLASCYYAKGEYSKATENWLVSLRTLQEAGLPSCEVVANIGNVYLDLGDYERALDYYRRADSMYQAQDHRLHILDKTLFYQEGIGTALLSLGRNSEAKDVFARMLQLSADQPEYFKCTSYASYAVLSVRERHYDTAEVYSRAALKAVQLSDDKITRASTYLLLAEVFFERFKAGITAEVLETTVYSHYGTTRTAALGSIFCDSAIVNASAIHNGGILLHALRARASMEEHRGNLRGALSAIHEAQAIEDSLFSARQSQQIAEINFQHVDEQREALAKTERERTQLVRNGLLGGIAIVLVSLAIVLVQQRRIKREKRKADDVLHNILPRDIAARLKSGESRIANKHDAVSILFADIVEFTSLSATMSAEKLVADLNDLFSVFDDLTERQGCEKIKTIGDAYMVVAGAPQTQSDHAVRIANLACELLKAVSEYSSSPNSSRLRIRIGVHCGEVVAGVIGKRKFAYDLWGDAVNTASRMESSGEAGRIHCTEEFVKQVRISLNNSSRHDFTITERGLVEIKGKGELRTSFIDPT